MYLSTAESDRMRVRWDELHANSRYCPRYPDDLLVRWVFRSFPERTGGRHRALDLGCGAGRHAVFLAREGFETYAADLSPAGVAETLRRAEAEGLTVHGQVAPAHAIDYPDGFFDAVVSYGVLCYATLDETRLALERVAASLRSGGRFFCMTRSSGDWRRKYGQTTGPCRYRLAGLAEGTPAEAEEGMEMTLLDEASLRAVLEPFSRVELDRRSVSWFGRSYVDDDWLVSAVR